MTEEDFSYEEYESVKAELVREINAVLDDSDKDFLLAFKDTFPIWHSYPFSNFPSIKRKAQLLKKLKEEKPDKHRILIEKLRDVLGR